MAERTKEREEETEGGWEGKTEGGKKEGKKEKENIKYCQRCEEIETLVHLLVGMEYGVIAMEGTMEAPQKN